MLRYYLACLATGCVYFKKNVLIDDTANAPLHWLRYRQLRYPLERLHRTLVAWKNGSRFATSTFQPPLDWEIMFPRTLLSSRLGVKTAELDLSLHRFIVLITGCLKLVDF